MDFLIEIVVLAAAAYGVKSYFFTSETLNNKEAICSRGATFVKRLVSEQILSRPENSDKIAPAPEAMTVETDALPPHAAEESVAAQTTAKPQPTEKSIISPKPQTAGIAVPEDSTLKRHFLAQLAAERSAITHPYPTDSVLRRHYDQQQIASLSVTPINEEPTIVETPIKVEAAMQTALEIQPPRLAIPEDSVLKRHFLATIQHKLELQHSPRPSDAVLKRHHKQLIQSRIDSYLAESAA